jgi:hypothetical protein
MSVCRHCGRDAGSVDAPLAVCDACARSPVCDRCGHAREDHAEVTAGGGGGGCRVRVHDFQTLETRECPCPGFRPVEDPRVDAAVARPEPFPGPPLRLA